MKSIITIICSIVLLTTPGCVTSATSNQSVRLSESSISFRKSEVTTRRWFDSSNRELSLVTFTVKEIPGRVNVAIVQYGDKKTGRAYCLDVYRQYESVEGNDPILDLLCHDTGEGWLSNIDFQEQRGIMYLELTRESSSLHSDKTIRHKYFYRFNNGSTLTKTKDDFYSDVK